MTNPDFVKLSESMGAKGLRCTKLADLPGMMKEFLEYDGKRPIVLECLVSSEHVYPMIPAGKALHEQLVSWASVSVKRQTLIANTAPPSPSKRLRIERI